MNRESSYAPYLWMLAGAFCIACMNQIAHQMKETCDWRLVALARASLAFAFAYGLARAAGAPLLFWKPAALWLRGIASSASLLCTFFALSRLPTAEVNTLTNTVPIWVALLSWPLLGVRPAAAVWAAAACGVVGVTLIQWPHLRSPGTEATVAVMLSLLAALTSAVAMLGLNRLKGVHPWAIVTHYSGVATAVMLLVLAAGAGGDLVGVPLGGTPDLEPLGHPNTLLLLLAIGVTATAGQTCVTNAFTSGQPARVAVVGLTQIVFALALDLTFGRSGVQAETLGGIALILAPTAWVMADRAAKQAEALSGDAARPTLAPAKK